MVIIIVMITIRQIHDKRAQEKSVVCKCEISSWEGGKHFFREISFEKRPAMLGLGKIDFTIKKVATKGNVSAGAVQTLRQYAVADSFMELP